MSRGVGTKKNQKIKTLKRSSGFTLLEVLVALAILGITITAILQLFSANIRSLAASEDYVAGSLEARSKMREVLDNQDFSERSWSGITGNGFRFQVSVSDTLQERVEYLPFKLVMVEVKVFWAKRFGEKSLTLRTMKMVEKLT